MSRAANRFLELNGLKLHYLDWGNAGAPPMVLLHGFSSSGRSWSRVARAFTEKYHVLALDHRGHGESDRDPESSYLLATFVGDLERFVEQLGLAPFTLMGHSMGGAVSLRYRRAASPRR